MHAHEIEDKL